MNKLGGDVALAEAGVPRRERMDMTIGQAAEFLGVSVSTVRRWTEGGAITCYRTPGNQRRYSRVSLEAFMRRLHRDWDG